MSNPARDIRALVAAFEGAVRKHQATGEMAAYEKWERALHARIEQEQARAEFCEAQFTKLSKRERELADRYDDLDARKEELEAALAYEKANTPPPGWQENDLAQQRRIHELEAALRVHHPAGLPTINDCTYDRKGTGAAGWAPQGCPENRADSDPTWWCRACRVRAALDTKGGDAQSHTDSIAHAKDAVNSECDQGSGEQKRDPNREESTVAPEPDNIWPRTQPVPDTCPTCGGSGFIINADCEDCGGTGRAS